MKTKLVLITAYCLLLTFFGFAQAPQKMSYQSVIRNGSGMLVGNQDVSIRTKILQGAADGDSVYVETHSVTTNANGLATLEIGGGTVVMGSFVNIDWSNGPYFLKTETDPNGGSNYTIVGVNQLLSVPYALYAKKAETVEMNVDGAYVLDYTWQGNLNGNNPHTFLTTTFNWLGNRTIMANGYITLQFEFPQEALDNDIDGGTADLDFYLQYNGQTVMPINFKKIGIADNAGITLPLNALIPNSTAGNSMQFSIVGGGNSSYSNTVVQLPDIQYGPYPVDVRVWVVISVVEL